MKMPNIEIIEPFSF